MGSKIRFAVTVAMIAIGLGGCTTDQIENAVLGGAKNWCRQQTTGCHVTAAPTRP